MTTTGIGIVAFLAVTLVYAVLFHYARRRRQDRPSSQAMYYLCAVLVFTGGLQALTRQPWWIGVLLILASAVWVLLGRREAAQ
jgi:O-antigen ligase